MTDPASSPVPMPAFVTSPAGYRRSGRTGRRTWHEGADFRAPTGTAVLAVRPGSVHAVFRDEDRRSRTRGYGNLVVLYHPREAVYTAYAHLSRVLVTPGLGVLAGTVLGASGATSNRRFPGMPPHLHFAVRRSRRSGRAPWPGPYPHPERHPALHREVWVDPGAFLARFGIETTGQRPGAGPVRIRPGSQADVGSGWPAPPQLVTSVQGSARADAPSATTGLRFISPSAARARMDAVDALMGRVAMLVDGQRRALGAPFVTMWRRFHASWASFYHRYPRHLDWLYLGNAAAYRQTVWYEARLREWEQAVRSGSARARSR